MLINDSSAQSVPASRTKYLHREAKFAREYSAVKTEWRISAPELKEEEKPMKKKPDISLYKDHDDCYPIIGNPIMARAEESERRYVNENVEVLERTFDPIRIKLRVMPSTRVQVT
jgi:tetratricopeptide (TPR) repeat protein